MLASRKVLVRREGVAVLAYTTQEICRKRSSGGVGQVFVRRWPLAGWSVTGGGLE